MCRRSRLLADPALAHQSDRRAPCRETRVGGIHLARDTLLPQLLAARA